MLLETFRNFPDFELLDTGDGYRLERWGDVVLARPDPQIIWPRSLPDAEWDKAWAIFKSPAGGDKGRWEIKRRIPSPWIIEFPSERNRSLTAPSLPQMHSASPPRGEKENTTKFLLKLSPFKHTGLFAEQAAQWEFMIEKFKDLKIERLKILNLFAYTGGATMVMAKAGALVMHVDASKPAIAWANDNHRLNNLPADSVRWILDDAAKFAKRELKRGAKYDGIIMDPPAFGHGPNGKTWRFNMDLPGLLTDCAGLLSDHAKFLIINGYATNSSALALNNLLEDAIKGRSGKIEFGELCLQHPLNPDQSGHGTRKNRRMISTGIFARWSS